MAQTKGIPLERMDSLFEKDPNLIDGLDVIHEGIAAEQPGAYEKG